MQWPVDLGSFQPFDRVLEEAGNHSHMGVPTVQSGEISFAVAGS